MLDRIKHSIDLVRASAGVLRQDKHLMLFPLISAFAMVLVIAAFALPVFGAGSVDGLHEGGTMVYSVAFLFYVVQYFVILYFNTALVGAAMIRLDGGSPTLGDGLALANRRLPSILGYAVISATVGVILRAIQERVGFIGRLIVGLIGAGWTVATFLVVPTIVARDAGPIEAVSESAALLKRTWGENVAGQGGIGAAFAFVYLALAVATVLGIAVFAQAGGAVLLAFFALVVAVFLLCMLLHSTLSGIYAAALYRWAANGSDTPGFDAGVLESAFRSKR